MIGHDVFLFDNGVRLALAYHGQADVGILSITARTPFVTQRHGIALVLRPIEGRSGLLMGLSLSALVAHLPATGGVIPGGAFSLVAGYTVGSFYGAIYFGCDVYADTPVVASSPFGLVLGFTTS